MEPTRILKLVRQIKSGVPVAERDESGATEEATDSERDAEDTWTPRPELRTTVATRAPGQAVQGDLGPSGLGFGLRDREAKGVRGRWGHGQLDDAQAVVQRLRGDPGLYPRPVVHLRGGDGRESFGYGWKTYVAWIQEIWSGQVERVISALEARQAELGPATKDDPETSPRQNVATTLGYLQTHKDRMRYDAYRCAGLPLTSCHVESTVKLFNRRVKGTEKFWSEEGAEAIPDFAPTTSSETEPLRDFWERRQDEATGRRSFRRTG